MVRFFRHRTLITAAALAAAVATIPLGRAQNLASAPSTQPAFGPATTQASTEPTTGPTTAPTVTLSFKDAPLDSVLDYLSQATGLIIIKDTPVDGRVNVVSRQAINADEAVLVLDTVLKSNGYVAVRQGRVLKIVSRDKARKGSAPVHFGADPAGIDDTDELITQVIPITNVDAVKLKQDLSPLISADADVTANGGANAIVVTDSSANIKRVVEVVAAIDQHESANFELRKYELKNASASDAVRLLTAIYKAEDIRPGAGGGKGQGGGDSGSHAKLNATSDDRTNTLFVTAAPETLKEVDDILKGLEGNPSTTSGIKIFPLKYADAASAVKLLTAVFKPETLRVRFPGEPPPKPNEATTGNMNAAADDRTNSVVVSAPTPMLTQVEDILKHLDADPSSLSQIKIIPLANADAEATAKLVTSLFKPDESKTPQNPFVAAMIQRVPGVDQSSVRVVAVADDRTNSLVVTAPEELVKAIADVVKTLDQNPASSLGIKVFQLKFADATAAAKLLQTIFSPDQSSSNNAPAAQGQQAVPAAKIPGVSAEAAKVKVNAAADDRTNTLVVSAPSDTMKVIEGIIKDLDANPAMQQTFFMYSVRNGQAVDIANTLNGLFQGTPPGTTSTGNNTSNRLSSSAAIGGNSSAGGSGFGGSSGFGGGGSGFGSSPISRSPLVGGATGGAVGGSAIRPGGTMGSGSASGSPLASVTSDLIGQVYVVPDVDTNSLLIATATRYEQRVRDILAQLDRPVPQVLIKVLVAEVTHDNSLDLGADWSILDQRASGKGLTLSANTGNAAAGAANGGLVVSLVENNLTATLHALAVEGKVDVLSRPYILTSDNQQAQIVIGSEVPIITNSQLTDTGQQINTVQYRDIGIILNVTPHINPEGLVICDVSPEVSDTTDQSVPIASNVNAPVFSLRSADTRVGIKDGNTIVIGGLMQDQKTTTVNKIPLLGDLPLIGPVFSRIQTQKTKTELLFFITPHVALSPDRLDPMAQEEIKGTKLTPRAVGPGVYEEQMRGMNIGGADTRPTTQPTTQTTTAPFNP